MFKKEVGLVVILVVIIGFSVVYLASRDNGGSMSDVPAAEDVAATETQKTDVINKTVAPEKLRKGRSVTGTMIMQGGASVGQIGTYTITELEGLKTRVVITLSNYTPGAYQPARIHHKSCGATEGIAYNLNNVVNGKSDTVLNVYFDNVLRSTAPHSVVVYKSTTETATQTSCGNII